MSISIDQIMSMVPAIANEIKRLRAEGLTDEQIAEIMPSFVADLANKGVTSLVTLYSDAQAYTKEQIPATTEGVVEASKKAIPPIGAGKTPEELAETWNGLQAAAPLAAVIHIAGLAATTVASAMSLGTIADAIDELWRNPYVAAALDTAYNTITSTYRFVSTPLLQRYLYRQAVPLVPEAYRLALASSKGIISSELYLESMAQNGFDKDWSDVWREENYLYPDFGIAAELYWRGVIDDSTFTLWMQRGGYTSDVIESMKALRELIPPADDLVTMVVREAFLPEMVTPAPEVFAKYMSMKGFSKDWSDRYWTMHWVPIALAQAYQNLWRGYWDVDKFKFALRIADVHPMWWDDIVNVAFQPPSLREMGYGWDVGVYREEDIKKYRRWEGLSEEDATLAARSMVAYRTEAEREAVRREYMHLFALGKITEEQFRTELKRLITAAEAVDLWVERGRLEGERTAKAPTEVEYRIPTSSEALWAYKNGLRDAYWLREALAALNWDEERINLAVVRANVEIVEAIPKIVEVKYKELTIAQIRDLYQYGIIMAADIPIALQQIGYSVDDALRLSAVMTQSVIEEAKIKTWTRADIQSMYAMHVLTEDEVLDELLKLGYDDKHARLLRLYIKVDVWYPQLRTMYANGWITEEEMYASLLDLGLSEDRANELMMMTVKAAKPERTIAEKDLTKAEILKGAKVGVITPTEASSLLMDLGYDEAEALYLLAINKVVAAGDPESYWEMKRITEQYKKAQGKPYKEVPDELILLEKRYKELKAQKDELVAKGGTEEQVAQVALLLVEVEGRYRKVVAEWEKASSQTPTSA